MDGSSLGLNAADIKGTGNQGCTSFVYIKTIFKLDALEHSGTLPEAREARSEE